MTLEGRSVRLRALEPEDIDALYDWENDCSVWSVSGTIAPFSRHTLEEFINRQQFDIFQTRQQRLVIERMADTRPVGVIDLFEFDPLNQRAGIGILIHDSELRGKGYASEALEIVCAYAHERLRLHQLWSNVGQDNQASIRLFRSAGFSEVGIKRDWQWTPEGYKDELLLQKILD